MPTSTLWVCLFLFFFYWTDKNFTGAEHLQMAKRQIKQNRDLTQNATDCTKPRKELLATGLTKPTEQACQIWACFGLQGDFPNVTTGEGPSITSTGSPLPPQINHQHRLRFVLLSETLLSCSSWGPAEHKGAVLALAWWGFTCIPRRHTVWGALPPKYRLRFQQPGFERCKRQTRHARNMRMNTRLCVHTRVPASTRTCTHTHTHPFTSLVTGLWLCWLPAGIYGQVAYSTLHPQGGSQHHPGGARGFRAGRKKTRLSGKNYHRLLSACT